MVSDATGSPLLSGPVELGELWASLLWTEVGDGLGADLPRALQVHPDQPVVPIADTSKSHDHPVLRFHRIIRSETGRLKPGSTISRSDIRPPAT